MLLFCVSILVMKSTVGDSVSSFKKIPEVEINDVYDSNDMVMTTSVMTKGKCGVICESLGKSRCQSFNVRPEEGKMRCEFFDYIPTNGSKMVEDEEAKLYERCEPMYVVASMKKPLKDNQTLIMLLDNKGAVYHVKSSDPTPRFIGHYRTVFAGFAGRVDDLFQAIIPPFGDAHFIREGEWMYCYQVVDETHQRFVPCEPKEAFPILYTTITQLSRLVPPLYLANDGIDAVFSVYQKAVTFNRLKMNVSLTPVGASAYHNCSNPTFCPHLPLFEQSSSGLFISPTQIGLYYEAKFYVYDFSEHKKVLRYSVCQGQDASYMMMSHYRSNN